MLNDSQPIADPSPLADSQLVEAALTGDQECFGELVRRYKNLVTSYTFSRVNQRELAEDLAQETFVRAFVALENLKKTSAFSAWVLTIAHNVCIDHLRSKSRTVSLEIHGPKDSQGEILLEDRHERPILERMVQEEIRDQIFTLIDGMSEEYRITLILRHVGDMRCEEIAEKLGVSLGTVTSRLSRAHRLLRERLEKLISPD